MSKALQDIVNEQRRQADTEGWSADHNDQFKKGEMAFAAACYAISGGCPKEERGKSDKLLAAIQFVWPWASSWGFWTPVERRPDLVKAAALILNEIERLDREKEKMEKTPENVS